MAARDTQISPTPQRVNTDDGWARSLDDEPRVTRDPPTTAPPFPVALERKAREPMYKSFGNALISTDPPEARVVACGEFDLATTSTLTGLLSQAVAAGCRDVRIDLSDVTFCDASTIGLLVGLDRRLRTAGGSLTIGRCSPCVLRLLDILGLDNLLGDQRTATAVAQTSARRLDSSPNGPPVAVG
jgi:anti-sigma B factor antagonist